MNNTNVKDVMSQKSVGLLCKDVHERIHEMCAKEKLNPVINKRSKRDRIDSSGRL
jgi:phosphoribosylformylglycinamidine (FGAM) synthase PurS component